MEEYTKPVWSFTRTNEDGTVDIKRFEADTWSQALQEFMNFVRGCGYVLNDDAVQLRGDYDCEHWLGYWCEPAEDYAPIDWESSANLYPPFEGNPEDYAFEPEPVACSLEDFIRAINRVKGGAV